MDVKLQNTPDNIQKFGLFCLWKYEERGGRKTKVPYNPRTLERGDSTDKSAFVSFPEIVNIWQREQDHFDGVGIGVFDQLAAVDIDHCIDPEDGLSELARNIVSRLNSYTEISPSGEGIRIFFGVLDTEWYDKSKYYINNRNRGLEIYLPGTTNRFLTFTGNTTNKRPVMMCEREIKAILDDYMLRQPKEESRPQLPAAPADLSDRELIDKAAAASNGDLFRKLWSGDISGYPSHSEADQALCNILAFWTGCNEGRIDTLFRQSGLMRDKWNRKQSGTTYGAITIRKAIADCKEVYDPRGDPSKDFAMPVKKEPAPVDDLELISLDQVEEKEPEWLIDGWIPKQSVTLIGAEGGTGKTSIWTHIIAKISAGKTTMFDSGYTERKPAKVMYFSSEDSADTVIKKKIRDQGGDMKNILTLDYGNKRFGEITFSDGGLLEMLIRRYKPVLCVFDPVQQFIPDRVKMAERNAMRRCLAPLKRLSEVYGTTFIIICHANKRDGASGRKRLADSSDLWDFARSVIMLGQTGENDIRYASHEKSNYSKLRNTIQYKITNDGVEYCGTTALRDKDYVVREIASKNQPSLQRQDAEQFIIEYLQGNGGRAEIGSLTDSANAADISTNAMRNAKSALLKSGTIKRVCESQGKGKGSKWYLEMAFPQLEDNEPFEEDQEEE